MFTPKRPFPKYLSAFLAIILVANSVLFAVILAPRPAHAIPVEEIGPSGSSTIFGWIKEIFSDVEQKATDKVKDVKDTQHKIWQRFLGVGGILDELMTGLALTAISVVLGKITNDITAWINGGGKGKIRILQDPERFLSDALDEGAGSFAGALLGIDAQSLCNADYLKTKLRIALTGPYAVPTFDEKVACTFTGAAEGLRKFSEDFRNGGWTSFIELFDKPNNKIGQTLLATEELAKREAQKAETARQEIATGKGYLNMKECFITKLPQQFENPEFSGDLLQRGQAATYGLKNGAKLTPELIRDISFAFGAPNDEEGVKGWIIANGGEVKCPVVTPAEAIANLSSFSLQEPIRLLEQGINGLLPQAGKNKYVNFVRPYLLAIANSGLNFLINKEKGLISGALARAKKPRTARRQPTGSLQETTQLAGSAGTLSASVRDFRSFLLQALLNFNLFVASASGAIGRGDKALGRIAIDEPNHDQTSCVIPGDPSFPTDPVSKEDVTTQAGLAAANSCYIDDRYGHATNGLGAYGYSWSIGGNFGWPGNPVTGQYVNQETGDHGFGKGDPRSPYAVAYYDSTSPDAGKIVWPPTPQPQGCGTAAKPCTQPNIYTLSPGKMIVEEAQWCGAYFEEIPASDPQTKSNYTHEFFTSDVPPATVCVDHWSGIYYERSGTRVTAYLAGTDPAGSTWFWNCGGDPGVGNTNDGKVLAYEFDWATIPSVISAYRFYLADENGNRCGGSPLDVNRSNLSATGGAYSTDPACSQQLGFWGPGPQSDQFGAEVWQVAEGNKETQVVLERYFSPTFEGGTVTLLNNKQTFKSTEVDVNGNPLVVAPLPVNTNEALLLRGNFYPELMEKMRELMEKSYVIAGYHQNPTDPKDYLSSLADQLGANPDDDPLDSDPQSTTYTDRASAIPQDECVWPNSWNGSACVLPGYKGSVTDVITKFQNIADIYQKLFAGLQDENSLEGVDKDFKILSPMEQNIKRALIGDRCPVLQPSATSTPDLITKCPPYADPTSGQIQYNMSRRFVFEQNDTTAARGLTTGFATNPFTGQLSSSLAGVLNLEEMATQLQSLPPDKNIVKLIRLRQILEQLQIAEGPQGGPGQVSPPPIRIPGTTGANAFLYPSPLVGVDRVQVTIPGYEKIQNWLNNLTDRNKPIQDLITDYGYVTAKDAYPEISKELDDILEDAVNQVTDKLKDVFLKRIELALEEAKINAQFRLTKFVEYTRDLNSSLKMEVQLGSRTHARITGAGGTNLLKQMGESTVRMLWLNAKGLNLFDAADDDNNGVPNWMESGRDTLINRLLGYPLYDASTGLTTADKMSLLGSTAYKIRTLAKFVGIDTTAESFVQFINKYNTSFGNKPAEQEANLDLRVKMALRDIYLFYTGLWDLENNNDTNGGSCALADPFYCSATRITTADPDFRIWKDARAKLRELQNDFGLMLDEISEIKEEYQNLNAYVKSQQRDIDGLTEQFSKMLDAYDKANVCFAFPTDAKTSWQPPASAMLSYSLYGYLYDTFSSISTAGAGDLVKNIALSVGLGLVVWLITGPVGGILSGLGLSSWLSRSAKKKAEREARERLSRQLKDCAQAVDDYNRLLGQLVDNFVCGKENKRWQSLDATTF